MIDPTSVRLLSFFSFSVSFRSPFPHLQEQEKNYLFVVDLQKFALGELRDGAVCKDVYQKIVDKIQSDRPDLLQYFAKTAGFGMGLEFRDAAYPLTLKGTRKIKNDQIFSLTLGFNGIPDGKKSLCVLFILSSLSRLANGPYSSRSYAVSLVDTVQVGKTGATVLSEGMKGKDDIMFYLEEEEKKPSKSAGGRDAPSRRQPANTAVVKSKLRNENRDIDADALNRRKQHQRDLATRRQEEGMEKYSGEGGAGGNNREKQWRRFESYVKDSQLPEAVAGQKVRFFPLVLSPFWLTCSSPSDRRRRSPPHPHPPHQRFRRSFPRQHPQELG
jgi:nucleosome binding factor SPN SPT16 subunit